MFALFSTRSGVTMDHMHVVAIMYIAAYRLCYTPRIPIAVYVQVITQARVLCLTYTHDA